MKVSLQVIMRSKCPLYMSNKLHSLSAVVLVNGRIYFSDGFFLGSYEKL